jgi:hypothetical protein
MSINPKKGDQAMSNTVNNRWDDIHQMNTMYALAKTLWRAAAQCGNDHEYGKRCRAKAREMERAAAKLWDLVNDYGSQVPIPGLTKRRGV